MEEKKLKKYELAYLLRKEEDRAEVLKILADLGAELINDGQISRIKLTYPIKKENFAFFGYLYFLLPFEEENKNRFGKKADRKGLIEEISSALKLNNKILRSIILGVSQTKEKVKRERPLVEKGEPLKRVHREEIKAGTQELTNEALEKRLEEILK